MIAGAIDLAGPFGACAIEQDGEVLIDASLPLRGREAARLADWIVELLTARGLRIADVARWTIGSGPGSFTFLRLVAALAAGWKFADPAMAFRCVPGALALAGAANLEDNETCGVLYDGRNKEILYFGAVKRNGAWESSGETAVLNAPLAQEFFASRPQEKLVCFECEKSAIEAIIPASVTVEAVTPELSALANNSAIPFDNDLDNLVYIRPAVV